MNIFDIVNVVICYFVAVNHLCDWHWWLVKLTDSLKYVICSNKKHLRLIRLVASLLLLSMTIKRRVLVRCRWKRATFLPFWTAQTRLLYLTYCLLSTAAVLCCYVCLWHMNNIYVIETKLLTYVWRSTTHRYNPWHFVMWWFVSTISKLPGAVLIASAAFVVWPLGLLCDWRHGLEHTTGQS